MDKDRYIKEAFEIAKANPTIAQRVLLEVEADAIENVKPLDRSRFLNICKRRIPIKRRNHLVQENTPLESYGYEFAKEPTEYKVIKGATDLEYESL